MQIIKDTNYQIFNDYYGKGELIKSACETTYLKSSNKTIEDFIKMLIKNKHFAMLEFCHYVVEIPNIELTIFDLTNTINYYKSKKYLECTVGNEGLIISGNGRAWYDIFIEDKFFAQNESIYYTLKEINPILFNLPCQKKISINVLSKQEVQKKEKDMESINKIKLEKDRNLHDWLVIKFENVSRGFTHEIVRHRTMSFAQTSTRRVLFRDLSVVIDGIMMNNTIDKDKIENCILQIQNTYNYLINRGYKKDDVRQLLPIGTTGNIFVAGNINAWKNLIDLRTKENSHWEIKLILNDVKKELTKLDYNI